MPEFCFQVEEFTKKDGSHVHAHERCIEVKTLSGENRVKVDDFIQRLGKGTRRFNPIDTREENRNLSLIIGDSIERIKPASEFDVEVDVEGTQEVLLDLLNGEHEGGFDEVITAIADEEGLTKAQIKIALLDSGYKFSDAPTDSQFANDVPNGGFVEDGDNFIRWSRGYDKLDEEFISADGKTGEPFVTTAYHGTTHDFYEFKGSEKGFKQGFLGAQNYFTSSSLDASQNYTSQGADLKSRIESLADVIESTVEQEILAEGLKINEKVASDFGLTMEELEGVDLDSARVFAEMAADKKLKGDGNRVLQLKIRADNPIFLNSVDRRTGEENGRYKTKEFIDNSIPISDDELNFSWEEIKKENNLSDSDRDNWSWDTRARARQASYYEPPIAEALRDAMFENEYTLNDNRYEILGEFAFQDEISISDLSEIRKNINSHLYGNDNGEFATQNLFADMLFNMGFDAIVLREANRQFGGLSIQPDTAHIHLPDKHNNQIKLADGRNVDFIENSDIRNQTSSLKTTFRDFVKGSDFEGKSLKEILKTPEGRQKHSDYVSLWKRNLS